MLGNLPFHFDRPGWLVLLVLVIPVFLLSRRSIGGVTLLKAWATFAIRCVVMLMLTIALARPVWEKRGEGLTVTVVLDRSQSIPLAMKDLSLQYLRDATEDRADPRDRLALITVARGAKIEAMPDRYTRIGEIQEPPDLAATNLEAGLNMALAIMPQDTANRIVLVSDGNETEGSVMAAAELAAANNVPVDILVLEYEHANEVIFERITAPSRARLGQSARIKMVLRSQGRASGYVLLKMNDEFLDLNGAAEGHAMRVDLPPGLTVLPLTISLDVAGPVQFEAVFEPLDAAADGISRNNRAVAVTFVGSEGKILVIDDAADSRYLVAALQESNMAVEVMEPAALARGPVFLSGYDAVVLANIPRWALTDEEDKGVHAYVHDLGGGLVMLGGTQSFGAGGWIDSDVARVLPVRLDPPMTRQMPRGALALIMHSTEMPQGNFWGQKVAIAAIETLSRLDYVGIIDYDFRFGGAVWEFGPALAGDKSAPIAAAKKMVMGDMPDFAASMAVAIGGLAPLPAGQKHVIIISDGDPAAPPQKLLDDFVAARISITTVLIAGHGSAADRATMKRIARYTGGTFYGPIKNPKQLPKIFIKEAKLVSRSLIVEGQEFFPQVVSRLPGPIEGFASVPSIDGYVLTAPREGLSQVPIVSPTSEGDDPIYAYWNYGLGKSIAYMSDLTGTWGSRWASWSEFRSFWEQSLRWVMRPGAPANIMVNTSLEGDVATVELEALGNDASNLNFLRMAAIVLDPDSESEPLVLQQTGPGRYRGEFRATKEGAYLVNINFVGGTVETPIRGNIQAAVSIPYPPEFKSVKHNAALLERVRQRTGGRLLSGSNPAMLDLFDRGDLEVPTSPRAVWDLLAIIAAAMFVLDVAARRIAVDRKAIAALAARTVGRRPEVGTDTGAAWKRVAQRRDRSETSVTARYEASEADRQQAIDVRQETAGAPGVGRPQKQVRETVEPEPPRDEGDYTSRLLAAKRRARNQAQQRPDQDTPPDKPPDKPDA